MELRFAAALAVYFFLRAPAGASTDFRPSLPSFAPLTEKASSASADAVRLAARASATVGVAELRAGSWEMRCLRAGILLAVIRLRDHGRVTELSGAQLPSCIAIDRGPEFLARTLEQVLSLGRGHVVLLATNGDAGALLGLSRISELLARLGASLEGGEAHALIGGTGVPPGYGFERRAPGDEVAAVMVEGGLFEVSPSGARGQRFEHARPSTSARRKIDPPKENR